MPWTDSHGLALNVGRAADLELDGGIVYRRQGANARSRRSYHIDEQHAGAEGESADARRQLPDAKTFLTEQNRHA